MTRIRDTRDCERCGQRSHGHSYTVPSPPHQDWPETMSVCEPCRLAVRGHQQLTLEAS